MPNLRIQAQGQPSLRFGACSPVLLFSTQRQTSQFLRKQCAQGSARLFRVRPALHQLGLYLLSQRRTAQKHIHLRSSNELFVNVSLCKNPFAALSTCRTSNPKPFWRNQGNLASRPIQTIHLPVCGTHELIFLMLSETTAPTKDAQNQYCHPSFHIFPFRLNSFWHCMISHPGRISLTNSANVALLYSIWL